MNKTRILSSGASPGTAADLARLAFATQPAGVGAATMGPRHLAFLPPEALELDLADPVQREFGDYELLEKIGQGGMGVVYRARQKSLQREVALKLLAAGPWASSDFIQRFQYEAQSAARMEHPNIVTVFNTGSHEDLHYFSMRLVRGESLSTKLHRSGPFDPLSAARLMRTVAEAVDYAHRLNVLHLDLKPGNILIDELGEPLVADFGLARRLDQALAEQTDEVSGTPSYMAPEQAQVGSQRIGTGTDIYGLGAILYELLVGEPPFLAPTPQETLLRVVIEDPMRPRQRQPGIPADLEAICLKCLAKDPDQRYSRARLLAEDLSRFLDGREVSVRPLGRFERIGRWARREPRMAIAAAALLTSLIAGITTTSLQWRRAERNAQDSRELLWQGRREASLRLVQDGNGFEAIPRLLTSIEEEERAGQSTQAGMERRRLGLLFGQGARLIDRMVVADANPMAAEISPDGTLLALAFNDLSIRWYDTASLAERGRVSLANLTSITGQRVPILLLRFVDNHRLRANFEWYSNTVSPEDNDSWLVDLDRKQVVEPPKAFADFADATYSPDGKLALLRNLRHQLQLWQVDPWLPLSPLGAAQNHFLPQMIDPRHRFSLSLGVAMRPLFFHRLPDMKASAPITLPGNSGTSAWALSGDGNTLAVGDFEGRLFLIDTASQKVRTLPTGRGREITWISFSEDDAWLAAASFDGTVRAFDVASGDSLVSGQISHDFTVRRIGLSHEHHLLIAAGEGRSALWQLPLPGPRAAPAERVGLAPAPHGVTGGPYPIAWSLRTGLFASSGLDGQVRLWRLPDSPLRPARAARQFPERTWFDGRHFVDVEWNRLRIVGSDGATVRDWLTLPQPPGFAELVDDGRLLVVTTGPQLRVYDTASMRLRFPPIALPDNPQRLLANADGSRVLMSFGKHDQTGFLENLRLYDARTGTALTGATDVQGPLRHLAISPDGTRLLVVGPADSSSWIFAASDLHKLAEYPHDASAPVLWADFATSGDGVLLTTHPADARMGSDQLLTWHPTNDRVEAIDLPPRTAPLGVIAAGDGAFVAGGGQDVFVKAGSPLAAERIAMSEPLAVVALSPDRQIVARAFRREVQLFDASTGALVGPPLPSGSLAMDVIVQLAFAPDSQRLVARTLEGHWLLWSLASERRSTDELRQTLTLLSAGNENQRALVVTGDSERATLRSHDPGAWRSPDPRPALALSPLSLPGVEIPARAADISPLLLDLSAYYDFSPDMTRNSFYNIRAMMWPLPVGVQRVAGVDFDVRGMIQVGTVDRPDPEDLNLEIHCLAVPPVPVGALHLLLTASVPAPLPTGTPLATVTLRYRDGGTADLPLRAGRELRGFFGHDIDVPAAFSADPIMSLFGFEDDIFVAPRLANPEPARPVRCLDIKTSTAYGPLLLLGITVEPGPPTAPGNPVIAAGK